MTILGTVTVVGKSDMRQLHKGFDVTKKRAKLLNKGLGVLKGSFTALGAAAGVAAVAFREVMAEAQRSVDVQRFAKRLSVSTDELRRMHKAAKQFGVSQDEINDGLLEFSKRSAEAALTGTGSLNDALGILNINVKEFATLNPIEQMRKFSDAQKDMTANTKNFLSDEAMGGAADLMSGFETDILKAAGAMGKLSTAAGDARQADFLDKWTNFSSQWDATKRDFIIDITQPAIDALKVISDILPYIAAVPKVNKQLAMALIGPSGPRGEDLGAIDRSTLGRVPGQPIGHARTKSLQEEADNNRRATAALEATAENTKQSAEALSNPWDF